MLLFDRVSLITPAPSQPYPINLPNPINFHDHQWAMSISQQNGSESRIRHRSTKTPGKIMEEERQRRRDMSRKQAKEAVEEKKWAARSEQILLRNHQCQRTKWEEEQARLAEHNETPVGEAEGLDKPARVTEMDLVDDFVREERQYLETMALMAPSRNSEPNLIDTLPAEFGSDDDEDYVQAYELLLNNSKDLVSSEREGCTGVTSQQLDSGCMDYDMG